MVRPSRPFRRWDNKQSSLLPLDTADWLPEGHLALFIDAVSGGSSSTRSTCHTITMAGAACPTTRE